MAESKQSLVDAHERDLARSRGIAEGELDRWSTQVFWGMSARTDDRVVVYERDNRHPGGEAFIAGPTPDFVYRTPQINQLVMQGMIVEVPEPKRTVKIMRDGVEVEVPNPRFPVGAGVESGNYFSAQPGKPIPLGRKLDPELYDIEAIQAAERRQAGRPTEITPNGAYVPSAAEVERPA